MADLVRALLERNRLTRADILSVGVGVPGTANEANGHIEDADNLGYRDEPFVSVLEEKLGLPSASPTTPTRRPGGSIWPEAMRRTPWSW